MAGWRIQGQYMETCNCSYVCPCIGSNLTAQPSQGDCKVSPGMEAWGPKIVSCELGFLAAGEGVEQVVAGRAIIPFEHHAAVTRREISVDGGILNQHLGQVSFQFRPGSHNILHQTLP